MSFPKTIEEFGYRFNEAGELRNIETGGRYEFLVTGKGKDYSQARYEALGELITEYIVDRLKSEFGMIELPFPIEPADGEPAGYILATASALTSEAPLLLLIPGIAIQIGQWARKIVINDNVNSGSMLDYVRQARSEGWEVLIFNSNENFIRDKNGNQRYIRGSESPEAHTLYVWDNYVVPSKSKKILAVAHSYGAQCCMILLEKKTESVMKRMGGIAFTDGAMMVPRFKNEVNSWIEKHTRNWVRGPWKLDTAIPTRTVVGQVAAGVDDHGYTTVSAQTSVIAFLRRQTEIQA